MFLYIAYFGPKKTLDMVSPTKLNSGGQKACVYFVLLHKH